VQARYTSSEGAESERELSPYGLVAHGGRWYVPAHDHGRGEPRALRADRFGAVRLNGRGEPPPHDFDAVAFVGRTLARVPWTHEVEVVLELPLETVTARFPPALAELEAGGERSVLRMRAEALDWVAGLLAGLGCDFTVVRPAELRDSLAKLADRLSLAARSGGRIRPERGC
jgi:predicted DNA-binding transcriptional regulator YafY